MDTIAVDHKQLAEMGWDPDELIEAAEQIRADQKAALKAALKAEKKRLKLEKAEAKRKQTARDALVAVASKQDGMASVEAAKAILGIVPQNARVGLYDSQDVTIS